MNYNEIIDKYYPAPSKLRDIFLKHSEAVRDLALEIAAEKNLPLRADVIAEAAMLHDIGIFMTNAPGIECQGDNPYIQHGRLGADLLRREGFSEETARVAERHTGSGITHEDIVSQNLPLEEDRSYMPESLLEKLICYADKFYSKSGNQQRKKYEDVRLGLERHSVESAHRLDELHKIFS